MNDAPADQSDTRVQVVYEGLCRTIEAHFSLTGERCEFLAEDLMERGGLNGYQVFDLPGDTAALRRIDRALTELTRAMSDAALTWPAREILSRNLLFGPHVETLQQGGVTNASPEGEEIVKYIQIAGKKNHDSIHVIEENLSDIRAALKRTTKEIEKSPKAKQSASRINAESVGIVDACRIVWERATGKAAPAKDLNPASKFYSFLADVLDCFENNAEPRSAFRAWVRERP